MRHKWDTRHVSDWTMWGAMAVAFAHDSPGNPTHSSPGGSLQLPVDIPTVSAVFLALTVPAVLATPCPVSQSSQHKTLTPTAKIPKIVPSKRRTMHNSIKDLMDSNWDVWLKIEECRDRSHHECATLRQQTALVVKKLEIDAQWEHDEFLFRQEEAKCAHELAVLEKQIELECLCGNTSFNPTIPI